MLNAQWFHGQEMVSHDGVPYPAIWVDNRLAALFSQGDIIRGAWGGPLHVVSGYRTAEHNTRVGGAQHSQHMEGRAFDIAPFCQPDRMAEQCLDLHARILRLIHEGKLPLVGGLGVYPAWVHVDVRPKPPSGHLAQWVGTGVGSEQAA